MNIVETVGKITNLPLPVSGGSNETGMGVSFEQFINEKEVGAVFPDNAGIDQVQELKKIFSNREPGPIGRSAASAVVKILDKSGFLDKVVESFISESGKADWINEGQRFEMKLKLGKSLENQFSNMNWSEIFEYVIELSLKIRSENMGLPSLNFEEGKGDSLFENLVSKMEEYLKEVRETVMSTK